MRLSSIKTIDVKPLQVRIICGRPTLLSEAAKGANSPPLSYIFIESVFATNVLGEAGEGRLSALLKAGVAKLNAALTPGTSGDLDTLLAFQAPDGGGSQTVNSLIQQATKSKSDITQDQNWWNGLFGAFNIADETIKGNIMSQVQQDVSAGTAPPTGGPTQEVAGDPLDDTEEAPPEAAPAAAAPPAPGAAPPAPDGTAPQGNDREATLAALKSERGTEQSHQGDIASQLAGIRKQREANRAEIGHLRNRLDQAQAGPKKRPSDIVDPANPLTAESVCREIAFDLLREGTVRQHLNVVTNYMLRNLAASTNSRVQIPTLNERGLGDRLHNALSVAGNTAMDALGDAAGNASKRLSGSANNQKAAKLAVKALTDHARSAFESKLTENGTTPEQITKNMQTWRQLKQLYERGNPTPQVVDAFVASSAEMKKIFELFQSGGSQFDVEPPVDAELVDEPPVDAELVGEPLEEPQVDHQQETGQPLGNKQKAMAKVIAIATGGQVDKTNFAGEEQALASLVTDQTWTQLMANSPTMRGAVEKILQPYAARGINTENLPTNARTAVLKKVFSRIK